MPNATLKSSGRGRVLMQPSMQRGVASRLECLHHLHVPGPERSQEQVQSTTNCALTALASTIMAVSVVLAARMHSACHRTDRRPLSRPTGAGALSLVEQHK